MICYSQTTLSEYLDKLAAREPVPGGGSAAALSACLGAGLVQMVAKYSLGKGKAPGIEKKIQAIDNKAGVMRAELLKLVTEDAEAYLSVVASRKKDRFAQKKAAQTARNVSKRIRNLSQACLKLLPYLSKEGNVYLKSDVDAAVFFLEAAIQTAEVMIKANE